MLSCFSLFSHVCVVITWYVVVWKFLWWQNSYSIFVNWKAFHAIIHRSEVLTVHLCIRWNNEHFVFEWIVFKIVKSTQINLQHFLDLGRIAFDQATQNKTITRISIVRNNFMVKHHHIIICSNVKHHRLMAIDTQGKAMFVYNLQLIDGMILPNNDLFVTWHWFQYNYKIYHKIYKIHWIIAIFVQINFNTNCSAPNDSQFIQFKRFPMILSWKQSIFVCYFFFFKSIIKNALNFIQSPYKLYDSFPHT